VATAALRRVGRGRETTIRAYGEMVDLLWKDGRSAASIKLEMLWNRLAGTHDFSLLCGYAMGKLLQWTSPSRTSAATTRTWCRTPATPPRWPTERRARQHPS
jgi:hypothetical protein